MIRFGNTKPEKPAKLSDEEKKARATALAQAAAEVRKVDRIPPTKPKKPARTASPKPSSLPPETKGRGRPKSGNETVTLRLSTAALDHFREIGVGWQAKLNDYLIKSLGL